MSLPIALLVATASTSTMSCGPKRVLVNGVDMDYEAGASQIYEEGKDALMAGDPLTAKTRFREVVELFEDSDRVPDALGELAHLSDEAGGCTAARGYLERLISDFPLHPRGRQAKKRLGECVGDLGPGEEPREATTFDKDFQEATSEPMQREVASKAADASMKAGEYTEAVRWLMKMRELERGSAQKAALEQEIVELIDGKVSFLGVRQLTEAFKRDAVIGPVLTYKLGRVQYHVRDLANAKETLSDFVSRFPGDPRVAGARKLLARIDARTTVSPRRLGVLLPLSGKHRSYGAWAKNAVELAIGKSSDIELVVRDTKSDGLVAAQMMEKLALEDGVIAVLGPLFAYAAQPAGYRAQQLGVPLLTISIAQDIPRIGPFVLRNGLTNKAQAEALVAHAMDIEGMKSFAVLYPRHPYGEELLHLFWDAVEKRQGEIRGVEAYDMGDTTFTSQVKALVARNDMRRRGDYRRKAKECENQPDATRVARCKDDVAKNLKPLIDFDGLFIPDYPATIAMVSAALAYEDIIVDKNPRRLRILQRTMGRKVKPVTLLGANSWNSPKLTERTGRNVEYALFTDAFFGGADDKRTAEFVREYKKAYSRSPRLYPDVLVYDSARILKKVILEKGPADRQAFLDAVRQIHDFPGVSGQTSFRKSNDAERPIKILTVRDGDIREVPPPDKPAVP